MSKSPCCFAKTMRTVRDTVAPKLQQEQQTKIVSRETKLAQHMSCSQLKAKTYDKVAGLFPKPPVPPSKTPTEEPSNKKILLSKDCEDQEQNVNMPEAMSIVKQICMKLDCQQKSFQIEKLTIAKEQLVRSQQQKLIDRMVGPGVRCYCYKAPLMKEFKKASKSGCRNGVINQTEFNDATCEEEDVFCLRSDAEPTELPSESEWQGFFTGYEVLSESIEHSLEEIKKCIEITHFDSKETIEMHLRAGVRCFMIDLFKSNSERSHLVVVRFRQCELNVSKELGFPITSTLFARLSPRLQYTGYLKPPLQWTVLCQNEIITMTTDRIWASYCTPRRIFVNARNLLSNIRPCDVLLIGTEIRVAVTRVLEDSFRCKVLRGGKLRSRMPVLFNKRCHRFRMSFCELEDIIFAKHVGINIIVSSILGTKAYFDNLCEYFKLLHCENLRIFACLILNNVEDEETNLDWALDAYDGFLGEISLFRNGCGSDGNAMDIDEAPRILFINQQVHNLIEAAHRAHKPFIFDPTPVMNGQYVMDPKSYKIGLYHPDKFLFSSKELGFNWFFLLANAIGSDMPSNELGKLVPYCDTSHTGSDTLALATAAASLEMEAPCIFVVGFTGRMAAKIASFRPKAMIYFISDLKSAANYISTHHNVVMLYYNIESINSDHKKSIYIQFLFGLSYAIKLKTLKHGEQVIFVFNQKPGQLFLDKYVTYKFDEDNFPQDLDHILF